MPNFMLLRTLIGDMKPLRARDMTLEEGRQARIVFGAVFNVPYHVVNFRVTKFPPYESHSLNMAGIHNEERCVNFHRA
jgi:hypothetical protein